MSWSKHASGLYLPDDGKAGASGNWSTGSPPAPTLEEILATAERVRGLQENREADDAALVAQLRAEAMRHGRTPAEIAARTLEQLPADFTPADRRAAERDLARALVTIAGE